MKKIAFVVNRLIKSGPVNVVYDIVNNIDRSMYIPEIVVLRDKTEFRSVVEDFKRLDIKITFFNFSFLKMELHTLQCAKIIDEYLVKEDIATVHAHGYQAAVIINKCKTSAKKIVTFHNICSEDFVRQKGFFLGTYMSKRYIQAIKRFDERIGITDVVSEFYKRKLNDENVKTIYNGIDCTKFIPITNEKRQACRSALGITDETVYVIIGTISKLKNVVHIVETAKRLHDKTKLFYFVGTGPLLNKCKKIAKGHNNIRFTGYQMDISQYLSIADYSIAASTSEGFGLAALEVVLSGIPLLYSNCQAFRELFYSCEYLKEFMFLLEDKNSLMEKISHPPIYTNNQLVAEYYKAKYDSSIMARQYQELY